MYITIIICNITSEKVLKYISILKVSEGAFHGMVVNTGRSDLGIS